MRFLTILSFWLLPSIGLYASPVIDSTRQTLDQYLEEHLQRCHQQESISAVLACEENVKKNLQSYPKRGSYKYCQQEYFHLTDEDLLLTLQKLTQLLQQARSFCQTCRSDQNKGEIFKENIKQEINFIKNEIETRKYIKNK